MYGHGLFGCRATQNDPPDKPLQENPFQNPLHLHGSANELDPPTLPLETRNPGNSYSKTTVPSQTESGSITIASLNVKGANSVNTRNKWKQIINCMKIKKYPYCDN